MSRALAAFMLAWLSTPAWGWGAEGHHLVAEIAQPLLTDSARRDVERLLALEPGATLASISTWADEVRAPSTARWHYVNFERGMCDYVAQRECPDGQCVVGALERQIQALASTRLEADRLKALKWVVHLLADVHQPLHAAFGDDRGGNSHQVQAFGRGSNLHAVWDSVLIQRYPGGRAALREAASLMARRGGDDPGAAAATAGPVADWAVESCRIASEPGFYPDTRNIGDAYASQWHSTLAARLGLAARRLAAVLNQALGRP